MQGNFVLLNLFRKPKWSRWVKLTDKAQRDLKLINRALENGDPAAYRSLMKLYRDPLYFMLYEKVNDQEIAKDLTIESLERHLRNFTYIHLNLLLHMAFYCS